MTGQFNSGSATPSSFFRPDIQGLRALAVLSVFFYHLWPSKFSGGYVGVDIFFVISGYLITGGMLRAVDSIGQISVIGFYQKRIKRLLPAATATLIGVTVASTFLPAVSWKRISEQILASALYAQNWFLAFDGADYMAQDDSLSPLVHFWSLSVEEQFYIVWPLFFCLLIALGPKSPSAMRWRLGAGVALIVIASLAYSVVATVTDPGLAYFATTTRAWELALGALFAFVDAPATLRPYQANALSAFGLSAVLATFWLFDATTPFPGYSALLPTLGAAALLVAGQRVPTAPIQRVLSSRTAVYIGDISYSLYLWHWPVIVVFQSLTGQSIDILDALAIFAISLALSHTSKDFVEDPWRRVALWQKRASVAFAFALLCIFLSVGASVWLRGEYEGLGASSDTAGAAGTLQDNSIRRLAAALAAEEDWLPSLHSHECRANEKETTEPHACTSGSRDAVLHLTLIGDSHAIQWEPAFVAMARKNNWYFELYAKPACFLGDEDLTGREKVGPNTTCSEYRDRLMALLSRRKPDVVVIAQSRGNATLLPGPATEDPVRRIAKSMSRLVDKLESIGTRVVVMKDTPWMPHHTAECMSSSKYREGQCDLVFTEPFDELDPAHHLAEIAPKTPIIDVVSLICSEGRCPAFVDGTLTFRDKHHLTATFSRALAPKLEAELAPFLEERSSPLIP